MAGLRWPGLWDWLLPPKGHALALNPGYFMIYHFDRKFKHHCDVDDCHWNFNWGWIPISCLLEICRWFCTILCIYYGYSVFVQELLWPPLTSWIAFVWSGMPAMLYLAISAILGFHHLPDTQLAFSLSNCNQLITWQWLSIDVSWKHICIIRYK